jgi:hyperosmotically inducible periplasmic protein
MRWKRAIAVLALSVSSLTTASAESKKVVDDNHLYDEVRLKLANDRDVGRGAIDVVVKDGAVTLKGRVHTDKQKQRATKVASKVKGVTSVDNQLQVEP